MDQVTLPEGLTGQSLVAGAKWIGNRGTFVKTSPLTLHRLGTVYNIDDRGLEAALTAAHDAFFKDAVVLGADPRRRAELLEAIATQLEGVKESLRAAYFLESALPSFNPSGPARFDVEFNRTVGQLRHHAKRLRSGVWCHPVIDRSSGSDLRKVERAIGPVAIWAAINFPLAFSVLGGDTAEALASGCPVIFKAHAEHPFTSEIAGLCAVRALSQLGMDAGWFSLIHGDRDAGGKLMADSRIAAGALTGSFGAAKVLGGIAQQRGVSFYAECGASNPVFVLPKYLAANAAALAAEYVGSVTMGCGQFCTCPGLLIVQEGEGLDALLSGIVTAVNAAPGGTMLSARTKTDFLSNVAKLQSVPGMKVLAGGRSVDHPTQSLPVVLTIDGDSFLNNPVDCQLEAFGHCSVVVRVADADQMFEVAQAMLGNLTATRYGTDIELGSEFGQRLHRLLGLRAGRLVTRAMPTGVLVCNAMHHGGPFPACTIDATSVGGSSRFLRDVCYQGQPNLALPLELQDNNPLGYMRLVNGEYHSAAV